MSNINIATRILLVIYLAFAVAMVVINLIAGISDFWALWPIWGVGVPVAALLGAGFMKGHRLLGAWIAGGAVLCLGLTVIDLFISTGTPWFFWPLAVWVVISAVLVGLTVDLLGKVPVSEPADPAVRPRDELRS